MILKNNIISIFLSFFLLFISCSDDEKLTQEQEAQNLEKMFSEITNLANSENCSNATEWTFTSYGNKACGGNLGFIAYSTKIDTEIFLRKIEEHRLAQKEFNKKWGIISDCSLPSEPKGIKCENGKPVFEY